MALIKVTATLQQSLLILLMLSWMESSHLQRHAQWEHKFWLLIAEKIACYFYSGCFLLQEKKLNSLCQNQGKSCLKVWWQDTHSLNEIHARVFTITWWIPEVDSILHSKVNHAGRYIRLKMQNWFRGRFQEIKNLTRNSNEEKIWGVHGANCDNIRERMQHKPANGLGKITLSLAVFCMLKCLSLQFLSHDVQTTTGQHIFGGSLLSTVWAFSFLSQMLHHTEDAVNGCQTKPSQCYHCCRGVYRTAHEKLIRSKGRE